MHALSFKLKGAYCILHAHKSTFAIYNCIAMVLSETVFAYFIHNSNEFSIIYSSSTIANLHETFLKYDVINSHFFCIFCSLQIFFNTYS